MKQLLWIFLCGLGWWLSPNVQAQEQILADFEDLSRVEVATAAGVSLKIAPDAGFSGQSMRMDFDFKGGGGYAIARIPVALDVAGNYQFTFRIRGNTPPNTLEFKLLDDSKDNVWWVNARNYDFPKDWRKVVYKKRHIQFAWGPLGGGELKKVAYVEFVITAATGGKGSVWVDDFRYMPLPDADAQPPKPEISVSSNPSGKDWIQDGKSETAWLSATGSQSVTLNLKQPREFSALTLQWKGPDFARNYRILGKNGDEDWRVLVDMKGADGGQDDFYLPESEATALRIEMLPGNGAHRFALAEVQIHPPDYAFTHTEFFRNLAKQAPRGAYPKYWLDEASYWTIVGGSGDTKEGLINEEGSVEVDKRFSIEPFVQLQNGTKRAWADATHMQALEDDYLPMPTVTRTMPGLTLAVTTFADGNPEATTLYLRYRLKNTGSVRKQGDLQLAIRPFQVNPHWQFLNLPGGFSPIETLRRSGSEVQVISRENGTTTPVRMLTAGARFQAFAFGQASVLDRKFPLQTSVTDVNRFATGILSYAFNLGAGQESEFWLAVPMHAQSPVATSAAAAQTAFTRTKTWWKNRLDQIGLSLPPDDEVGKTIRANLAYLLINRDKARIQPGSRSYDRAWIRDGSLSSSALMQFGFNEEVKAFAEWYATFQHENGYVPCCVDDRGGDPVPEHDSHGQLIFLIADYYRYNHDVDFLRRMFPHVIKAVHVINELRGQRRTEAYQTPEKQVFFGLMPESISHEGYSAKPMHSYWDDLFALKGLRDAVWIAEVLGETTSATQFKSDLDAFQHDFRASIVLTMQQHNINYMPGCAELGDFDATSTTVALDPVDVTDLDVPMDALRNTFARYADFFNRRMNGTEKWEGMTPYEWRTVGSFVRLNQPEQAHAILRWFWTISRPAGFRHWAEVVWHDPKMPRFIGDMPHTWVGSDFLRSVRNFLIVEHNDRLVYAPALLPEWVKDPHGVGIEAMPTRFGRATYHVQRTADGKTIRVQLKSVPNAPAGIALELHAPLPNPLAPVEVDGKSAEWASSGVLRFADLRNLPAEVVFHY